MISPIALQAVLPAELVSRVHGITEPEARKLLSVVHRTGALPKHAPPPVRRGSLESVRACAEVPAITMVSRSASQVDPFVKYTFASHDGGTFESVRIPLEKEGRVTVCVSSQIGCALGCRFCATGRMGLVRNLAAWEIVEQVRRVRADLAPGQRVHGVVFQGMGEPLANLKNVVQAARVLSEPSAQAIDARAVTICTAGLPSGIRELARALPNVRVGWSIGSAIIAVRRSLMPIEVAHSVPEVIRALGEHAAITRLAPLWAYTLLAGVNDSAEHARVFGELALAFARDYGLRPRISLIPYNPIGPHKNSGDPFERTEEREHEAFAEVLREAGISVHRRYSGGSDVDAACGQLATRTVPVDCARTS
jgi:23S rRNA (adenine2503-C2)-methyltransferase